MKYNEHLAYLLLPPSKTSQIGPEKGKSVKDGVARLVSAEGSYRYVYYKDGVAIAAIQVVDLSKAGQAGGHLANAFVKKEERRKGLATMLVNVAKKDFPSLTLSDDLSDAGRKFKERVQSRYVVCAGKDKWYHLTDRARFKLDPKFTPVDNSVAIHDRSGKAGIYLAPDVEKWVNGHGYWRPFVVEFHVDPSVLKAPGVHGRWGGEMFVPASLFDKLKIERVIPIDAYARETFKDYGWVEEDLGHEFDTGKPIPNDRAKRTSLKGYKYTGLDVRDMPSAETSRLKKDLKKVKG